MAYLLNLAYLGLLLLLSPWLLYSAVRKGKYREGGRQKALGQAPRRTGERPCVWLHAVSVGEVNLLAPVVARIERRFPDWEIVISTTTKTGLDLASKKYAPHMVFYCPLDFTWAVNAALARVRPDVLVLAELELWPNLIASAHRRGVNVAVINGRLGEKSRRGYGRIRPLVARLLGKVDLIAAQSDESARRFLELGARPDSVHVTGSLKFDGVETDCDNAASSRLAKLAGIEPGDVVFLAGSTQDPEERLAIETYRRLRGEWPELRLVLVPRHPHRFDEAAAILDESGVSWQRRSRLEADGADPAARILLVDLVGELAAWWGTADIGFVGGSLGSRGGQNMIEPAAYGAAVCFGPRTHNFREIVRMLLETEAAEVVHDGEVMTSFVRRCLERPDYAARLGRNAQTLVCRQQGAADRTMELLAKLMQPSNEAIRRAA